MVNNSLLTQRKFPEVIRQPYADDSSSDGENSARDDDFHDTSKPKFSNNEDTELKRQRAAMREDEESKAIRGYFLTSSSRMEQPIAQPEDKL